MSRISLSPHVRRGACLGSLAAAAALMGQGIANKRRFQETTRRLEDELCSTDETEPVTEEELRVLPPPIQRLCRYSGVMGRPRVRALRLEQMGEIRTGPTGPWVPFAATELLAVGATAGFVWEVGAGPWGIPLVRGRDSFAQGAGCMEMSLGGLVPLLKADGADMDESSMIRYLSELMWSPSAFLEPNISFGEADEGAAQVTLTLGARQVSARYFVDDIGKVQRVEALRYRADIKAHDLWTGFVQEYATFEGRSLPACHSIVWGRPGEGFEAIRLQNLTITSGESGPC